MRRYVIAALLALLLPAAAFAQGINNPGQQTGPAWAMSLISAGPVSVGAATRVPFDTEEYDTASVCTTGASAQCVPNKPGYYSVTCQLVISATTGGAVGTSLGTALIRKNGSGLTTGGGVIDYAQAAAIVAPNAWPAVTALVNVNGTTDAISCFGASGGTGATVTNGSNTMMVGYYVHP